MKFTEDQLSRLNNCLKGFITSNRYLRSGTVDYSTTINQTVGNILIFRLDKFAQHYQDKFILPNFEGYCNGLFAKLKPRLAEFLAKENIPSYSFNCTFYVGEKRYHNFEIVLAA